MATSATPSIPAGPNKSAVATTTEISAPKDDKPAKKDRLNLGESLMTAQLIVSPNDIYCMVVQDDGNIGVYKKDVGCLWVSGTWGSSSYSRVVRATLNTDGNLVFYTRDGLSKWESNTGGKNAKALVMQDDGNLVITTGTANIWATNTAQQPAAPTNTAPVSTATIKPPAATNAPPPANPPVSTNPAATTNPPAPKPAPPTLSPGQTLEKGGILTSANQKFKLIMQGDGNCVLYNESGAYWATGADWSSSRLVFQNDGNIVIASDGLGRPNWSTHVRPPFGSPTLTLRDTGDLVVTDAQGHVLWSNNGSLISPDSIWVKQATNKTSPLYPGTYIVANQTIASANGCFFFSFLPNGMIQLKDKSNLVLWSSGLSFPDASKLLLQFDGNLVLTATDGKTLWASGTGGAGDSTSLLVTDDGNVTVLTWAGVNPWSTNTFFPASRGPTDRLRGGESLFFGQSLVSANGKYKFQFQDNYNFTIRNEQNLATSYRTAAAPGMTGAKTLSLDSDGIFHVRDNNNSIQWSSLLSTTGWLNKDPNWAPITDRVTLAKIYDPKNYQSLLKQDGTYFKPIFRKAELVMQDDGSLVMRKNDQPFWNIATFPTDAAAAQFNNTLKVGASLRVGGVLTSYNGQFSMVVQSDGRLSIYHKILGVVWCTDTWQASYDPRPKIDQLTMQWDGNLVLFDTANCVRWASGSHGTRWGSWSQRLVLEGDGNARIFFTDNFQIWELGRKGILEYESKFLTDGELAQLAYQQYSLEL